jgi:hypothetical protein
MDKIIALTRGMVTVVDGQDYDRIMAFCQSWQAHKPNHTWYAQAQVGGRLSRHTTQMHRFILSPPSDMDVDHEDGDGLNNRRRNLRVATRGQNLANRPRCKSQTGYRGVQPGFRSAFYAQITVDGQRIYLGTRGTAIEAARLYDEAALYHFGEFATLNFPGDTNQMPSDIPPLADPLEIERTDLDEHIQSAFAKPSGGQLVSLPSTNVAISDAIITAQKVAVERDEAKVLRKIRVFAQAAGSDWFYRYPVNRGADWIEGPSIKCANNVARYYGNCQIDTRVVDNGDSWIIYARFVDYETGFSYTRPFQQRKGQQTVKTSDGARALDIALQIGVSKAIRNVVCNALETFTTYAFEEAKSAIVDKVGKNLEIYRERVTARLTEMKVLERVEAAQGRAAKDWLASDIARIIAQLQAINDGMATLDETWPPTERGATEQQKPATPQQEQPSARTAPGRPTASDDLGGPDRSGGEPSQTATGAGSSPEVQGAGDGGMSPAARPAAPELIAHGNEAAAGGIEALNRWWTSLSSAQRGELGARGRGTGPNYARWEKTAAATDAARRHSALGDAGPREPVPPQQAMGMKPSDPPTLAGAQPATAQASTDASRAPTAEGQASSSDGRGPTATSDASPSDRPEPAPAKAPLRNLFS